MSADGPAPERRGAAIAPGYEVLEHLARSRVMDVYDAWSEERGTRCIVKALRPDRAGDACSVRRLVAEGRLLLSLSHPHIVRGYELRTEPRPLVVMETLTGETLEHLIERSDRRLPARDVAHLGLHLGAALRYLHGRGWLHLDLKPTNVVAEIGRAKLIDLSIARRPGRASGGLGTWSYMAPEQVTGGELTPAADVWGLGTVLYEALSGQAAFDPPGHDGDAHPTPQLDGPPIPLRRLRRVPAAMAALVDGCLAPEPAARPCLETVMGALEALAGLPPRDRRFAPTRRRRGGGSPSRARSG